MEAVGELAPNQATRLGGFSDVPPLVVTPTRSLRAVTAGALAGSHFRVPASDDGGSDDLVRSLELLKRAVSTAVEDAGRLGFREAADFAANVEDVSRTLEYLQIVAAGAVDRTRREASAAARAGTGSVSSSGAAVGWTTGWGTDAVAAQGPVGWAPRAGGWVTGPGPAAADPDSLEPEPTNTGSMPSGPVPDPADDGCRNAAEFLRTSLRISIAEARRRLSLADAVLPRTGITGHIEPPEHRELAAAVAAGTVASRSATIVTMALERVRHHAPEDTMARMEHDLTRHAAGSDPDFVSRIAKRWIEGLDQDGSEPSEEELRRRQGVFLRQPRRGLYHVEFFATADQYEPLLTAMNTATNPRTRTGADTGAGSGGGSDSDSDTTGTGEAEQDLELELDQRTRPQQLLDGLVGACKAGLVAGALPAAGGLRPQVMVTIDYRDLLDKLENLERTTAASGTGQSTDATRSTGTGIPGTGSFTFTGPVTPATVRKIACDADIIPVLLGSQGRILDIGRTTRVFPPHIRKALTARDQGCAFPGCTIPAPWCEAHHITY
nr:HNH endonuclease signature motif containing protein [Arthrobacter sp. Leaf337]